MAEGLSSDVSVGSLDKTPTDVTFELDNGERVECHRHVLARASPYLKAMFIHDEKQTYQMRADEFRLVHGWAYDQQLPETVDLETLTTADFLLADDLLAGCVEEYMRSASRSDLAQMMEFVATTDSLLSKHVTAYMARNFDEANLWLSEFDQLPHELVLRVLQSDQFFVSSESFLWFVLKSWAKADLDNRRSQLAELVTHIKFLQMGSPEFYSVRRELAQLTGDFFDQDLFKKLDDLHRCRAVLGHLVYPALNWSPYQEYELHPVPSILRRTDQGVAAMEKYISPRIPSRVLLALGGWVTLEGQGGAGGPSTAIEIYLYTTDSWYQVPTLALASNRAYHDTAVIGTTLYVVGGFDGQVRFKTVEALDLQDPHAGWKACAQMETDRCYVSTACVQGKLYALGGHSGESVTRRLASCEVYDPTTDKWAKIPDMAHERSDAGVVVHDGKIIIAGGFNGQNYLCSVEMFDPENNTWVCLPNMNTKRGGVSCAIFQNKLYALGGCDGDHRLDSVECLDLDDINKGWTDAPPMREGRSNFGAYCVTDQEGPKLVAMGGYVAPATTEKSEYFDGFDWFPTAGHLSKPMSAFATIPVDMTPALKAMILDGMMQRSTSTRVTEHQH